MADSPTKNLQSGVVTVEISIDGTVLPEEMMLQDLVVVKEVNKIPYAKIVILDGEISDQTSFPKSEEAMFEPGGEVEIKLSHDPSATLETVYKGILVEHGIRLTKYSGSNLILTCRDEALALTVGRKNKIFYEQKDSDIISDIISESGIIFIS